MGIPVRVTDLSPDDHLRDYGAGALIRLERAPAEAGAYAEIDTEPIAAGKYSYELFDAGGTASSWYRARFSNAAGDQLSQYGDPWSLEDPQAYATVDDYLVRLGRPLTDRETRLIARIEQALIEAREQLDAELGVSFFRIPATGSSAWTVDAPGGNLLHVHEGIVALDQVEVRDSLSGTWAVVDADDWLLEPDVVPTNEPAFHIRLTGAVSRGTWPIGSRLIRLTGARGWPRIPKIAVKANAEWARQSLAADPTFAGGPIGPDELGRPIGPNRVPDSVWRLKRTYAERFVGCWL